MAESKRKWSQVYLFMNTSHGQDNTYQGVCYTSRGTLAGTRNSPMGLPNGSKIKFKNLI